MKIRTLSALEQRASISEIAENLKGHFQKYNLYIFCLIHLCKIISTLTT